MLTKRYSMINFQMRLMRLECLECFHWSGDSKKDRIEMCVCVEDEKLETESQLCSTEHGSKGLVSQIRQRLIG